MPSKKTQRYWLDMIASVQKVIKQVLTMGKVIESESWLVLTPILFLIAGFAGTSIVGWLLEYFYPRINADDPSMLAGLPSMNITIFAFIFLYST